MNEQTYSFRVPNVALRRGTAPHVKTIARLRSICDLFPSSRCIGSGAEAADRHCKGSVCFQLAFTSSRGGSPGAIILFAAALPRARVIVSRPSLLWARQSRRHRGAPCCPAGFSRTAPRHLGGASQRSRLPTEPPRGGGGTRAHHGRGTQCACSA